MLLTISVFWNAALPLCEQFPVLIFQFENCSYNGVAEDFSCSVWDLFLQWCCWRFQPSRMWRCVTEQVVSDVLNVCSTFIFRVNSHVGLLEPEDKDSKIHWNVWNPSPKNTAPHPRILASSYFKLSSDYSCSSLDFTQSLKLKQSPLKKPKILYITRNLRPMFGALFLEVGIIVRTTTSIYSMWIYMCVCIFCNHRWCGPFLSGKPQDSEHLSCSHQKKQKPFVQIQDKMVAGGPMAGPSYCGLSYLPDSDRNSYQM